MLDPRLERAEAEIRAVLETAATQGKEQLPPRVLIQQTMERGIGEEAARVALWDMVDQRAVEFTPGGQVRLTGQPSAERAAIAS
jgi:hypothetical protein